MWFLFLSLGISAHSFTMDSQYRVATEPGALLLGSWDAWDSESSSDYIAYLRPIQWDEQWLRKNKVFDISVGSISSKQFMVQQRLKLVQPLTERVEFRFHLLEDRDFEQDHRSMPLEMAYKFNSRFSVAGFGQPSLYKSDDDIGLALTYFPFDSWHMKIAALWGDFQRNQRNLNSDQWGNAPEAYTLTSTFLPESGLHRWEAHYEPNSVRTLNGARVTTLFYKMVSLSGIFKNGTSYRVQADQAMHNDQTRKRFLSLYEYRLKGGQFDLRPGLAFFYREHRIPQGAEGIRELLPTLWVDLPRIWSFGYDATVFDRNSTVQNSQHKIEHRANMKATANFTNAGELAALLTFDLDRFGSGETWEGGALQFRTDF